MPFEIVLGDIINMQADAIVTAADTEATIRSGADAEIYNKAGPKLSEARKKIGPIAVGQTAVTPAFDLNAEYIIHAVVPVRQGGLRNEETLLSRCYKEALILAKENHCDSIAFPLLSAENNVFSKSLALQIAIREFRNFLMENDMQIYLVVSDRDDFLLSEKLFRSVADYIDETYGKDKTLDEYGITDKENVRENELLQIRRETKYRECHPEEIELLYDSIDAGSILPSDIQDWESLLADIDAGFSETLLRLIDRTGKTDSYIYKKANIDRRLFSKIRSNMDYKPSKTTALAFAIALELDLDETRDFIARAGFALSHSSKFDIIVEYFILHKNYDVFELNEVLFAFDQPLIGA